MKVIINDKEIILKDANSFFKKLKGFMFQKNIGYCLRFKTSSIHTFFMKQEIDVVMTDKYNNVLYIFNKLPKNKIVIKKNVYYTYEFPSGFINKKIKKIEIFDD